MEAIERLEETIDLSVSEARNQVGKAQGLLYNRIRIIAELLQQDIIDNGSGRGVCLGAVLDETVDQMEEHLLGVVESVNKIKEPCISRIQSFQFDQRESLALLNQIAEEGKTRLIKLNKRAEGVR